MKVKRFVDKEKRSGPAFIFDLDGTLVDSVYQHVLAWQEALEAEGIHLAVWRIHRRIGMSGGLLVNALVRETGGKVTRAQTERLQKRHAKAYSRYSGRIQLLPGSRELLTSLTRAHVLWGIATSSKAKTAGPTLRTLNIDSDIAVVTRDLVKYAKPDPDLFIAAAEKLGVDITSCIVVGDSVWDILAAVRARALAVGLLSGGYGQEELERAGAYRVYQDPADLLRHLDEVGVRFPQSE